MRVLYNIVDYLRIFEVNPVASASSQQTGYPASNALIYDTQSSFWSDPGKTTAQWWSVDFKQNVKIRQYQILTEKADASNSWLYKWTLYIFNNNKWQAIHGPITNANSNKSYDLKKFYKTRYAQIAGETLYSVNTKKISFYYVKFIGETQYSRIGCTCKIIRRNNIFFVFLNLVRCK